MHPELWGPGAWKFLHSITFNYPKEPTSRDKNITQNSLIHYNLLFLVKNVLITILKI